MTKKLPWEEEVDTHAPHSMHEHSAQEHDPYYSYTPPERLPMPKSLPANMHARWVRAQRAGSGGSDWDEVNLSEYFQDGYRMLNWDEISDEDRALFRKKGYDGKDIVMNGDLVLMVVDSRRAQGRREYYEQKTRQAVDSANTLQGLGPGDTGKLPTVAEDRGSEVQYGYRK